MCECWGNPLARVTLSPGLPSLLVNKALVSWRITELHAVRCWRPLCLRTKFDKFNSRFYFETHPGKLHFPFFSPRLVSTVISVKPFPDFKMIKLLITCFHQQCNIFAKTRRNDHRHRVFMP